MVSAPDFNPFALLTDPGSVSRAVESSASLCGLHARVFRPLDGAARAASSDANLAAFDAEVDVDPDADGVGDSEADISDL